jgi:hypothetical protein
MAAWDSQVSSGNYCIPRELAQSVLSRDYEFQTGIEQV